MGTSFVQMAYNMTDMIWLGRLSSESVAAVGTAGFFTWLAMAFILIPKVGAEVGVAQSVGRKDLKGAKSYIRHTLQMIIGLGVLYGAFLILFRRPLIEFFHLGTSKVEDMAVTYLVIVSLGMVSYFINPVFTSIFNGYGNSKTPFLINAVGLVVNMALDPLMIFGFGPFPAMGVAGAALATILAQFIVTLLFILQARKETHIFSRINLFERPEKEKLRWIVKLGLPVAVQSGLFTFFAMILARIISKWGPVPIAVQKVGSQIESISWMTAGGFSTALSTFVGQNYGAKKWRRIVKGYFAAMGLMAGIGVFATALLIFGARPVFSIFIPEEETIKQGIVYLKILGVSQLLMCIEIGTQGAFNGLGKTIPPSVVGILGNALRIPMAIFLAAENLLGLNGVWWSISISSILKGLFLFGWFLIFLKTNPNFAQKRKFSEAAIESK
jgi:putative MATE family efflux protein